MTTPHRPPDDDDGRDPHIARLLEVAPLDELTRARLVRTALAGADEHDLEPEGAQRPESSPERSPDRAPSTRPFARTLTVAAALLVVLVVGLAVLVPRGSDDTGPTAVDAPARQAAPTESVADSTLDPGGAPAAKEAPASATAESGALDATVPTPLTLPSLGDLGNVSTQARLMRAATARLARPSDSSTVTVTGCRAAAGNAFGTPVAAGTGTIDGRPAVVVVSEQAAGTTAVVAVRGRSCGRAVSAVLP